MDYTEKYHLPQWKKEDRIMMEDFNQMCADLEEGISKAAEKQYATGHYTGVGDTFQDIILGFRPAMVLIRSVETAITPEKNSLVTDGTYFGSKIQFWESGFRLFADVAVSNPRVNKDGTLYMYIAFK